MTFFRAWLKAGMFIIETIWICKQEKESELHNIGTFPAQIVRTKHYLGIMEESYLKISV